MMDATIGGVGPVPTDRPRRKGSRTPDALLTLAAIAGVLSLCAVLASSLFGLSLITFSTGSMSPAMPAGSLALVREVPASELRPGQVVTLERPGGRIPVTHRIVDVSKASGGESAAFRSIEMRGDANPVKDAAPYVVTSGLLVLCSVPGAAGIATIVGHPITGGVVSVFCCALVLWAFWPRSSGAPKHLPRIS